MTSLLSIPTQSDQPIQPTQPDQYDYVLLDGSGSMVPKWWDMLNAIDGYVSTLQSCGTKSHIHLSIFTTPLENLDLVARDQPIAQWTPLSSDPVGSHFRLTPLYDAINNMGLKLRSLNPVRCSVLICTDGDENGSIGTDLVRAKSVLDWMRSKGWSVTFIGCDFNNSRTARALGAEPSAAIGVQQKLLRSATEELAKKRHRYGLTGAPIHWTPDEQQQFGGYLSAPSAK